MDDLLRKLKAVADPVRLQMLELLRDPSPECCSVPGAVCACDFELPLGLSQPTVSHHLKVLVEAGLIGATKRGRWVYYRLKPEAFATLTAHLARFQQPSPNEVPARTSAPPPQGA